MRKVVRTPITACGRRMAKEFSPNIHTDRAISHIDAGGLSTVIALPESEDPHRNAHQLFEPACAAAE